MYQLLNKSTKWLWSKECNATFQSIKSALKSTSQLVHFDSSLPIVLSCDAFRDSKAIPAMASLQLQRWALTLGGYDYTIQYRKGVEQCHTDALSHLPLPQKPSSVPVLGKTVLLMEHLSFTPISAAQVSED